ncbi:hypothetical protein BO94DRAFT_599672 [Aspergillus sclerotioniger CBS 115572]|uniref:Actin-like ATPase domain-containing protein n=1 Tax=Aspergillus sclerotioniger CBS 115572 TaxID=1450535 RepID=A0A317WDN9_9EURO|nr:hypothetical protein BO94DRAFT_599672 [Aspergillus sclerotioniger CBS 115572]PWY83178.1 hypothetical protein BO94DRAFT_599672 [Aspergillus sclerotioniger CBS 115572]
MFRWGGWGGSFVLFTLTELGFGLLCCCECHRVKIVSTRAMQRRRGQLMDEFEGIKRRFDGTGRVYRLPFPMFCRGSQFYDAISREIIISDTDMRELFGSLIRQVIETIYKQVSRAKDTPGAFRIQKIFVAGGITNSRFARGQLSENLHGFSKVQFLPRPGLCRHPGPSLRDFMEAVEEDTPAQPHREHRYEENHPYEHVFDLYSRPTELSYKVFEFSSDNGRVLEYFTCNLAKLPVGSYTIHPVPQGGEYGHYRVVVATTFLANGYLEVEVSSANTTLGTTKALRVWSANPGC